MFRSSTSFKPEGGSWPPDRFPEIPLVEAQKRLSGVVTATPVVRSEEIDRQLGFQLFVKAENMQKTGSFKFRGAMNMILRAPEARRHHLLTWSSGNHGIAVAEAARLTGAQATILVPSWVSHAKLDAIRSRGAAVIKVEAVGSIASIGIRRAMEIGALVVPSYDDEYVIAGQATVITEALQQMSEGFSATPDTVIVPCGGGSLAAGAASALSEPEGDIDLYGAEPEACCDTFWSFRSGYRVPAPTGRETICDALRNRRPGSLTFSVLRRRLKDVVLVSDDNVREAMKLLFHSYKLVAEPSGASAIAASIRHRETFKDRVVLAVLSGGNVTMSAFSTTLTVRPNQGKPPELRVGAL